MPRRKGRTDLDGQLAVCQNDLASQFTEKIEATRKEFLSNPQAYFHMSHIQGGRGLGIIFLGCPHHKGGISKLLITTTWSYDHTTQLQNSDTLSLCSLTSVILDRVDKHSFLPLLL